MLTVHRVDVHPIATTERRRTERLTALTLASLLAAIAIPILIVTVALVVQRPEGWIAPDALGVVVAAGLVTAAAYVLAVPTD
jgi:hypothetical protein